MSDINTAEDAINIAERFLKRYYAFFKLEKAVKRDNDWLVEFDTSIIGQEEIVRIILDKETGSVIEYTKP